VRNYESIFILHPESADETVDSEIAKTTEFLKKENAEVSHVEKWGKRRLAYLVKKQRYGIYVLIRFSGSPELVGKLDHHYRFRDGILKYQTISLSELAQKASTTGSYLETKPAKEHDESDDSDSPREHRKGPRERDREEVSMESSDG
jgi:small subunit ribosomal protein S6